MTAARGQVVCCCIDHSAVLSALQEETEKEVDRLAAPAATSCGLSARRSARQIIFQITNNKPTHKTSALFRAVTIFTCFRGVSSVEIEVGEKVEQE
jgi:hypothetical protein